MIAKVLYYQEISIHAPIKERRALLGELQSITDISIHAPIKERPIARLNLAIVPDFNPRSHKGATFCSSMLLLTSAISIHAPIKERQNQQQEV